MSENSSQIIGKLVRNYKPERLRMVEQIVKSNSDRSELATFLENAIDRQSRRLTLDQLAEEFNFWLKLERLEIALIVLKHINEREKNPVPDFPSGGHSYPTVTLTDSPEYALRRSFCIRPEEICIVPYEAQRAKEMLKKVPSIEPETRQGSSHYSDALGFVMKSIIENSPTR